MEATKKKSNKYYEATWHWIEDTYLKYFGENRTSYAVKDTLHKGEVSGNKDVDGVQRSVGDTAANQFGEAGVGGSVGSAFDKKVLRGNV